MDSNVAAGYTINHEKFFRLRLKNYIVGIYGITFKKNSHYLYQSMSDCAGFFLRKNEWLKILDSLSSDEEFYSDLKNYIEDMYENRVNKLLHKAKEKDNRKLTMKNADTGVG